ncbi:hypothetical protein [Streptomyces sp. B6B3]|uniref:hypothetical protein n=1 Tax=Streptomyces sp. B6B3 TaxID=3153570 RepID=UPI00325E36E3
MPKLNVSRRALLTATTLGAVTAAVGARPALATPRGRRTGPVGITRTTATAADVTAVPLGDPDGLYMWRPRAVNRHGDAVGGGSPAADGSVVWIDGELHVPRQPGTGSVTLEAINDGGQLVGGFRRSGDYKQFAVVFPDGVAGDPVVLEPGDDVRDSCAYFLNNDGQVLYTALAQGAEAQHRTFRYDLNDGSRTEVEPPAGYSGAVRPRGLNDAGQVIATSGDLHFFWENGAATPLAADGLRALHHLNEAGQVLASRGANAERGACVWRDGVLTDVPPLNEHGFRVPPEQPLNDLGDVIGVSDTATGLLVPILHSGGRTTELPVVGARDTSPRAINNSGLVVGRIEVSEGIDHACQWQNGEFLELGVVQGWVTTQALWVTDQGVILAYATDGTTRAGVAYQLTVS